MSLVAWYPLINDTRNHSGVSGLDPKEGSPVFEDANHTSPLGNSFYTGKLTLTSAQWAKIFPGNDVSIAMWVYTRADGTYSSGIPFMGNGNMTAPYNRKYAMFHYPDKTSFHLSWQNDDSSGTYYARRWSNFFEEGKWTHVAAVQDAAKGVITVYRNGEVYQSTDSNNPNPSTVSGLSSMSKKAFSEAPLRNSIDYQNICDMRFYDHALTASEVKRIYQTLVIHLSPTSLHGMGGDNRLDQTVEPIGVGWTGGISAWKDSEKAWYLTADKGWTYFYWNVPTALQGEKIYFSFDYQIVDRTNLKTNMGTNQTALWVQDAATPAYDGTHRKYLSTDARTQMDWEHAYIEIDSCQAYIGFVVRGFDTPVSDGAVYTVKFRNLFLTYNSKYLWDRCYSEYGVAPLDDPEFANCGILSDIRFDFLDPDLLLTDFCYYPTPQYSVGVANWDFENCPENRFNNWNHYFHCNPFTVAFWVLPFESENFNDRNIFLGSYDGSGDCFNIEKTAGKKVRVYYSGNPDWTCNNATLPDNTMTHVAITRDGSGTLRCYINGELKGTDTNANWTRVYEVDKQYYGIGRDFSSEWANVCLQGGLNDFRIYATCLSEDDIKNLYSVAARIMEDGSIEVIEFIETDDAVGLTNTHILKTNGEFYEGTFAKIAKRSVASGGDLIYATELIEI